MKAQRDRTPAKNLFHHWWNVARQWRERKVIPFPTLRFSTSSRRCGLLAVIIYDMAMAVTNRVCKHCKEAELDKNGTTSLFSVRCNKTELHIFLTLSRDAQCLVTAVSFVLRISSTGRKPGEMQS